MLQYMDYLFKELELSWKLAKKVEGESDAIARKVGT